MPAFPTLLLAGSLAGRAFGYRVLSGLCRLSINPGSCVSETEARFLRWGVWSLVIAKFIPGFSTVAPPIAGALRMPLPSFIVAAGVGAAIWAGAGLLAGSVFDTQLQAVLEPIARNGATALGVVVLVLCASLVRVPGRRHRGSRGARPDAAGLFRRAPAQGRIRRVDGAHGAASANGPTLKSRDVALPQDAQRGRTARLCVARPIRPRVS